MLNDHLPLPQFAACHVTSMTNKTTLSTEKGQVSFQGCFFSKVLMFFFFLKLHHVLRDSLTRCLVSLNVYTTAALSALSVSIHFSETAARQIQVDAPFHHKQNTTTVKAVQDENFAHFLVLIF